MEGSGRRWGLHAAHTQTRMPDLLGAGVQRCEEVRKRFHRAPEGGYMVYSSGRDGGDLDTRRLALRGIIMSVLFLRNTCSSIYIYQLLGA